MTNTFKKSLILAVLGLAACVTISAETMYVVPAQCNVPLKAGMNNAKTQFFTWDGTTATITTAVSCNITSTAGFYYNSTSLAYADITNAANYSNSSTSNRTMRGFKITSGQTLTVSLGSISVSKVIVGGRCASNDPCTLEVAGETVSTNNKNSFVKVVDANFSGQVNIVNNSAKEYNVIIYLIEAQAPTIVHVTSVSLNKTTTSLEQGSTETLTATVMPANATDKSVSWSSDNTSVATVDQNGQITAVSTGSANITVTTTDGAKTASCAVTVTAPSTQIDVTGISFNKTTTTLTVGGTESLTITYTPSDANTGKAVTWTSSNTSVATVDQSGKITAVSAGSATITATSTTNNTITVSCAVTVQAIPVTGVTLDKTTANLQIGQTQNLTATVLPSNATNKAVTWSSSADAIATVDQNGVVTAIAAGQATITVTTTDGNKTATCAVTVTAGPPVPSTTLTLHEPEVYAKAYKDGGYGTNLVVHNGREFEVYYMSRDPQGDYATLPTITGDKKNGIENTSVASETYFKAADGWAEANITSMSGGTSQKASAIAEFDIVYDEWRMQGQSLKIHIKGYDQFSYYGYDKNVDIDSKTGTFKYNRRFQVYIDDVLQPETQCNKNATVRRYDITAGEHVIEVRALNEGDSRIHAFSLREAQVPRVKYLKGNDTTQVIMQATAMRPVTYYTKYNSIGETSLIWDGQEATGIALQTRGSDAIGDTLVLTGTANCPVGIYKYTIQTFLNGNATSSLAGQIEVQSDIKALTETAVDGFQNMSIDDINFSYHALSAEDITLTWENNNAPGGITGSGANGMYSISGTPTTIGTYIYTLTVLGGNSISDTIVIKELNLGNNPILYLYKNAFSYNRDGVYQYLTSPAGGSRNLIPMKAAKAKRAATQYAPYKWILISEDIDANNPEVIDIIRDGANLPILNLKGFTYAKDDQRLSWGDPNNGAIDSNTVKRTGCMIRIERAQHPIFKKLNGRTDGLEVKILDNYDKNGVMPIEINDMPVVSTCLATGYTRGESYYEIGELQTAIHEIPADQRNGKKYICLPLGRQVTLSQDGKKLLDGIIEYLLSPDQATIEVPETRITKFVIEGKEAIIDEDLKTIRLELTDKQFHELNDLRAVKPQITLADPNYTHVTPASGEELNLQYSMYMSEYFVVSDYVNRVVYDFKVQLINTQDIDELYEAGQWVNIFDIYGRKVSTTNEDIYSMDLPHGMYIVVTENGNTLKIMR